MMTQEQLVGYVQSEGGAVLRNAVTRKFKNLASAAEIEGALQKTVQAGRLCTFTVGTGGRPAEAIALPEYIRKSSDPRIGSRS